MLVTVEFLYYHYLKVMTVIRKGNFQTQYMKGTVKLLERYIIIIILWNMRLWRQSVKNEWSSLLWIEVRFGFWETKEVFTASLFCSVTTSGVENWVAFAAIRPLLQYKAAGPQSICLLKIYSLIDKGIFIEAVVVWFIIILKLGFRVWIRHKEYNLNRY